MKTRMHEGAGDNLFEFARSLRRNPTKAEELLWTRLRGKQLGVKFRRQHPIGHYIVDFFSFQINYIIEVDGEIHLEKIRNLEDRNKDETLSGLGYAIDRFSNQQVLEHLDEIVEQIQLRISILTDLQKSFED